MNPWVYIQEPRQLHNGKVPDMWRESAAGYLVQVLGAPDLHQHAMSQTAWEAWLGNAFAQVRTGVGGKPWHAVTQASNRHAPHLQKILYPWRDDGAWDGYIARCMAFARAARDAGVSGIVMDLEDYAWRFGGQPLSWTWRGLELPGETVRRRVTQLRAGMVATTLTAFGSPLSIMDFCASNDDLTTWQWWTQAMLQHAAGPVHIWAEDTFASPTVKQAQGVRVSLSKTMKRAKIPLGLGLLATPPLAAGHRLGAHAEKTAQALWCYPWSTT